MLQVGSVWKHRAFYQDASSGHGMPKYLVVLGMVNGDILARLLTSKEGLRSTNTATPCSHDQTRPGYFLGVLTPNKDPLPANSWLDLRGLDEIDGASWADLLTQNMLAPVLHLSAQVMCPLLTCAISAEDTTRRQAAALHASRQALGCTI